MWKTPQHTIPGFGTGLVETENGIVGVYEHVINQPEKWCLTHVHELTKCEYDNAKKAGIIG